MSTNVMNNVNVFANEFISGIMGQPACTSGEYKWLISFYIDYDEQERELYTKVQLSLYDSAGEEFGSVFYDMVRTQNMRYTYTVSFSFEEDLVSEHEDSKDFKEIKDAINMREDGLYDKMCAYLHKYNMEQTEIGVDRDIECPPRYEAYYSPSRIGIFMQKYGISPYVPIAMEVVDDKGMPMKNLSINGIYFNDESNNLVISLKEN